MGGGAGRAEGELCWEGEGDGRLGLGGGYDVSGFGGLMGFDWRGLTLAVETR